MTIKKLDADKGRANDIYPKNEIDAEEDTNTSWQVNWILPVSVRD